MISTEMLNIKLIEEIINYQINLVTIVLNLFVISVVASYQFVNDLLNFTNQLLFDNRFVRRLKFKARRLFTVIKRRIRQYLYQILARNDLNVTLTGYDCNETNQSIFFSNKQNDHQILQLIESMDIVLNYVKFWPISVRQVIKHVEKRLFIEAEYSSRILHHCQSTRSQLCKDEELNGKSFMDFRPVFITTINQEFELTNEIIQNCEALLSTDFIEPLEDKIKDFNENLTIIKRKWNSKVNQMQDLVIELRKNQKIYLKCALHYVKLTHNAMQNEEQIKDVTYLKREDYLKHEKDYAGLLQKAENEYKLKISDVNKCLIKLERFKSVCLSELQHLIDDASSEVRRLTVNYITKLYPNQKNQLLNQMIGIVPEVDFRNFVNNLKIPHLPHYTFTRYDEIKC